MTDIRSLPDHGTVNREDLEYVSAVLTGSNDPLKQIGSNGMSPEGIRETVKKNVKKAKGFFSSFKMSVLITLLVVAMLMVKLDIKWKVLITFVVVLILQAKFG